MQNASNPTKSKVSPEERARLRRNQRNSRARKQLYIQELEQRWSECVRLGVQASVEIQREGRRVHEENEELRSIIYELGMSHEALQERLKRARVADGSLATYPPNCASTTSSSPLNPTPASVIANGNPTIAPGPPMAPGPMNNAPLPAPTAQMDIIPPDMLTSPEENMAPDALQTWDLYSWVNALSSIKDAYGVEAQSQFDYDDVTSPSNARYQGYRGTDIMPQSVGRISTNDTPWALGENELIDNNTTSVTGISNPNFSKGREMAMDKPVSHMTATGIPGDNILAFPHYSNIGNVAQ